MVTNVSMAKNFSMAAARRQGQPRFHGNQRLWQKTFMWHQPERRSNRVSMVTYVSMAKNSISQTAGATAFPWQPTFPWRPLIQKKTMWVRSPPPRSPRARNHVIWRGKPTPTPSTTPNSLRLSLSIAKAGVWYLLPDKPSWPACIRIRILVSNYRDR